MRSLIRVLGVSAWLALAGGCSDPVAEAQADFDFLYNHGSLAEACEAGKRLEAAAAKTRDHNRYVFASGDAFRACYDRDLYLREGFDPRHPEVQADNLDIGAAP